MWLIEWPWFVWPADQAQLIQMVVWMLQRRLLIQLHTYVCLMVPPGEDEPSARDEDPPIRVGGRSLSTPSALSFGSPSTLPFSRSSPGLWTFCVWFWKSISASCVQPAVTTWPSPAPVWTIPVQSCCLAATRRSTRGSRRRCSPVCQSTRDRSYSASLLPRIPKIWGCLPGNFTSNRKYVSSQSKQPSWRKSVRLFLLSHTFASWGHCKLINNP